LRLRLGCDASKDQPGNTELPYDRTHSG
jgi:hypothetical protein